MEREAISHNATSTGIKQTNLGKQGCVPPAPQLKALLSSSKLLPLVFTNKCSAKVNLFYNLKLDKLYSLWDFTYYSPYLKHLLFTSYLWLLFSLPLSPFFSLLITPHSAFRPQLICHFLQKVFFYPPRPALHTRFPWPKVRFSTTLLCSTCALFFPRNSPTAFINLHISSISCTYRAWHRVGIK